MSRDDLVVNTPNDTGGLQHVVLDELSILVKKFRWTSTLMKYQFDEHI